MSTTKITHVAAGILIKPDGQFLLGSRPEGKPYAGWWEFPGGKLEVGETAKQALIRELHEEMGVEVIEAQPWVVQTFTYPHATVRLNFFKVTAWQGEPQPHEGQAFVWQTPGATTADPILPANTPILRGLQLPPVLAFSNVAEMGEGAWLDALSRRLEQGMRWVVLREPQMEPQAYRALAAKVLAQCRAHGAHLLLHDAVESVQAIGADGVHLPARRLMQTQMRPDGWCGASVHNMEELTHACALGLDYAVLGSVKASKTHPGGAVLGWESVGQILAAGSSIPVYGIGGLSTDDLDDAIALGAQGVAMIRAAWI